MTFFHYDGGVVADQATGRPLMGQPVKIFDEETDAPIQAYREGQSVTLVTGSHGLIEQFQTEDSTRRVRMEVGPVRLRQWSQEMMASAAAAGDDISSALEQVEVVRAEAAAIVPRMEQIEAMAGLAPGEVTDAQTANLITRQDTETRNALNAAYAQKGDAEIWAKDYPSIQAAVDAVGQFPNGGTVHVTENTTITQPITLPANRPVWIVGQRDKWITAGAAMPAMIHKGVGYCIGGGLTDVNLDGNRLAERCVDVLNCYDQEFTGGVWQDATQCVAEFARTGEQVLGIKWTLTKVIGRDNSRPGAVPSQMPAYGVRLHFMATDNTFRSCTVKNANVGIMDEGNANVWERGHMYYYPHTPDNDWVGECAWRITGDLNRYINCYADTATFGFDIQGERNLLIGPMLYWPLEYLPSKDVIGFKITGPTIVANAVVNSRNANLKGYPFVVAAGSWPTIIEGCHVFGNGFYDFWQLLNGSNPTAAANVWLNGSGKVVNYDTNLGTGRLSAGSITTTALSNLAATNINGTLNVIGGEHRHSGPAGTSRTMQYQTVNSPRWIMGTDATAESGGDAGSRWALTAYTDAGGWKYQVMQADRRNGVMQFPTGAQMRTKSGAPTDADFGTPPNDGTVVIDQSGSKLWVRVSGAWKSVTLA